MQYGVTLTAASSLFSGTGVSLDFTSGALQLTANGSEVVSTGSSVAAGEWINAAIVREDGTVRLYIEGELVDTADTSWTDDVTVTELGSGFKGRLDGFRLWSTTQDASEISNGARGFVDVSTGNPEGLERYYRFDDDQDHIVDATGNAETGHDLHTASGSSILLDETAPAAANQGALGFIDTQVVVGLFLATDMAFLPDGRMLITQKDGTITLVEDQPRSTAPRPLISTLVPTHGRPEKQVCCRCRSTLISRTMATSMFSTRGKPGMTTMKESLVLPI